MNTPLTKFGAEKLKEELHQLKTKERRNVIDAIAEARSHGDLSENAEYDAAKERQAFVEGRIAEQEQKLSTAQIIDPATLDAEGRVVFASTVDLEDLDNGQKVTYQIVGIDEALAILGGVVFGVFRQVALRPRLRNGIDDRRPVDRLQAVQLGLEFLGAAGGDGNGGHWSVSK
jgi:transcription elongation factor GreA